MTELFYEEEVYAVVGAAMEVYNQLGPGFLEPVYQEAMEVESAAHGLRLDSQCEIPIHYKGRPLKKYYIADLVDPGKIIVELKAASRFTSQDDGQVLNYLKATGLPVGVLINFGSYSKLQWKRLVLTKGAPGSSSILHPRTNASISKDQIRED